MSFYALFTNLFRIKFVKILSVVVSLFLITGFYKNEQQKAFSTLARESYDKNFFQLKNWFQANTTDQEVYTTLDGDLLLNLPSYIPARSYIPNTLMSAMPQKVRLTRFCETLQIYGYDSKTWNLYWENLNFSTPEKILNNEDIDLNRSSLDLVIISLFYMKYTKNPPTKDEFDALKKSYQLCQDYQRFSGRLNYLVINKHLQLLRSPLQLKHFQILFSNNKYSVFKILDESHNLKDPVRDMNIQSRYHTKQ